jgi:hypothetical protein
VGGRIFKLDTQMGSTGVLVHIMDGFLGDAKDFALGARGQRAICAEDAEVGVEGGGAPGLDDAAEADGEGGFAGVLRAQGPDGLAGVGKALADVAAGGVEVLLGGVDFVEVEEFGKDF